MPGVKARLNSTIGESMRSVTIEGLILEERKIINSKSKYEMIEIEQVNPRFTEIKGAVKLDYNKLIDDTDPKRLSVKSIIIKNPPFKGANIIFIDCPEARKSLPGTTGKVAFLIADDAEVPAGSMSGEKKGWNLEFLASQFDGGLFKVVDSKWESIVKERYEKIIKAKKDNPVIYKVDRRYDVKGVGVAPESGNLRIQVDHQGQDELKAAFVDLKKRFDDLVESQKSTVKKGRPPKSAGKIEEYVDGVQIENDSTVFAG